MWGLLDLGISDHCLVYVSRKKRKIVKTPSRVLCKNYNNFNEDAFKTSVANVNWEAVYNAKNMNIKLLNLS